MLILLVVIFEPLSGNRAHRQKPPKRTLPPGVRRIDKTDASAIHDMETIAERYRSRRGRGRS
jgi:hypothetical protein